MKQFLLLLLGLLTITPAISHAENSTQAIHPLPANLLFTTSTAEQGDYPRNVIMRVDAKTLDVSLFYIDFDAHELMPLGWSPQGDLLAVYRRMPPIDSARTLFPRQLCIVDRTGSLVRCLDDSLPMHYVGRPIDWPDYYPIAWGADGQTIFFDTEYANDTSTYGYGRRLVEASIITGKTLRVVYDYPDPYPVTLSPNLNQLTVGFEGEWLGEGNPVYLLDLLSQMQIDISVAVLPKTGLAGTCLRFSPQGSYITVIAQYNPVDYVPNQNLSYDYGSLLLLLDMQGSVRHIIGEAESSAPLQFQECPGWQPDERSIVFLAFGTDASRIMHYSLADQQTTTLYEPNFETGHESHFYSPLIPSADGQYIALTVSDEAYGQRQVAVLYPDGEIRRIDSPYRFGLYPLWIPPLRQ